MALDFGSTNTTRYYTIPHADELDLPASNWSWGVWTRVDDNAGTDIKAILSAGAQDGDNSCNIRYWDASHASTPNTWGINSRSTVYTSLAQSSAIPADGKSRLMVFQHTGAQSQIYACLPGAAAALIGTDSRSGGISTVTTDWRFGGHAADTRYWRNKAGELWRVNGKVLSAEEIAAIANGVPPIRVLGSMLVGWWNFLEPTATVKDLVGANDATQVGSSWPATAEHFPMRLGGGTLLRGIESGPPVYAQTKFRLYQDDGQSLGEAA